MAHTLDAPLKTIATSYIQMQTKASLLLLLLSQLEARTQSEPLALPKELLTLQQSVQTLLFETKERLAQDETMEERGEALQQIFALKEQLLTYYHTVHSYQSQWKLLMTLCVDEFGLREYKEQQDVQKDIDWNALLEDCQAFLEEGNAQNDIPMRIAKLLACIPIAMTREHFYDFIQTCLQATFQEESITNIQSTLKAFEGFCFPEQATHYHSLFPSIATFLDETKLILPHTLSDEALDLLYEDLLIHSEQLDQIEEAFTLLLNDINALLILFYQPDSFEVITADPRYLDLYLAVCECMQGDWNQVEQEAYLDQLMERTYDLVEVAVDSARAVGQKEYDLLQRVTDVSALSEETQTVLLQEAFVRACYFNGLMEELCQTNPSTEADFATAEEKRALFSAFLQKTKTSMEGLSAPCRKVTMQMLLSVLPSIYNIEELMSFLKESIYSHHLSTQRKYLLVQKIGTVFQEQGFSPFPEEENEQEANSDPAYDFFS